MLFGAIIRTDNKTIEAADGYKPVERDFKAKYDPDDRSRSVPQPNKATSILKELREKEKRGRRCRAVCPKRCGARGNPAPHPPSILKLFSV